MSSNYATMLSMKISLKATSSNEYEALVCVRKFKRYHEICLLGDKLVSFLKLKIEKMSPSKMSSIFNLLSSLRC